MGLGRKRSSNSC